jgi:thymidylate synthase
VRRRSSTRRAGPLRTRKPDSMFDYRVEDFRIIGYDPHNAIKAPVAV